jgi:hypothetical protein
LVLRSILQRDEHRNTHPKQTHRQTERVVINRLFTKLLCATTTMAAHTCSSQLQKQKEGDQEMQRRGVERTKNLSEEEKTPQPSIVLQKSHHQSDDEE